MEEIAISPDQQQLILVTPETCFVSHSSQLLHPRCNIILFFSYSFKSVLVSCGLELLLR